MEKKVFIRNGDEEGRKEYAKAFAYEEGKRESSTANQRYQEQLKKREKKDDK